MAENEAKKFDTTNQEFCCQTPEFKSGEKVSKADFSFLRNILNGILNPVIYTDREGVILGVNRSFARQIAGLPEETVLGLTLREIGNNALDKFQGKSPQKEQSIFRCFEEWDKTDRELLKSGQSLTLECEGICADGVKRTFLTNKSTFSGERGEILGFVTVMQDITQVRETEKALRENLDFKERLLDEIPVPVFYKNTEGRYIGCNKHFAEEIIGLPKEKITGRIYGELTHQAPHELIKKYDELDLQIYGQGIEQCCELKSRYLPNCLGREFVVIKSPFFGTEGEINGLVGAVLDVTERNKAQKELQESEEKYRSFIKNFKGIVFQLKENFVPLFLHGSVEEITGYSEEEFLSSQLWKELIHPEDLSLIYEEKKELQASSHSRYGEIDFRIICRDGRVKWVHAAYQKISGSSGKPVIYQGTIHDITEKKEAEENLANAEIARKKEIHHRIKNNLQVISSLLDLQAERFKNRDTVQTSEVLDSFLESQNRVVSMALIHEELHRGGKVDTLNFSTYLQKLSENLFQTNRLGNSDVSLEINLEESIFFDMDTAVPLGIIVNELVSNSFKHAFPDRKKGRVQIELFRKEVWQRKNDKGERDKASCQNTGFVLTVKDNGVGMPESLDIQNSETLGLQLITTLVNQLGGKLEVKRDRGTEFTIKFTVAEK
ncbi:PAS domain S-box protein [Methanosarcina sp.]|uniref:PAS domain S-box protein n=1 Tax=Methanosarcina sp. TaxID=2213 RepID=UPI003C7537C0